MIAQMEADELADKAELSTHLTPIEYAKTRGMAPQKVYYQLRHHPSKLSTEICKCGRKVIDIAKADIVFGFKKVTDDTEDATGEVDEEDQEPNDEENDDDYE
jgi:hypothetical protein